MRVPADDGAQVGGADQEHLVRPCAASELERHGLPDRTKVVYARRQRCPHTSVSAVCAGALNDLSKTPSATFPFTAKIAIDRRAA